MNLWMKYRERNLLALLFFALRLEFPSVYLYLFSNVAHVIMPTNKLLKIMGAIMTHRAQQRAHRQ